MDKSEFQDWQDKHMQDLLDDFLDQFTDVGKVFDSWCMQKFNENSTDYAEFRSNAYDEARGK